MIRKHYRGFLQNMELDEMSNLVTDKDRMNIQKLVNGGRCKTVALFQYEQMIFLYFESIDESLQPKELFPKFSEKLEYWPGKNELCGWVPMFQIYYHSELTNPEDWERNEKKVRRGRIAFLLPEKVASYIYYHKALVDEGLFEGDKYQSIAWHEEVLFSYFEEPKCYTHIKKNIAESSKIIEEWIEVNPESHFDHTLTEVENFLFIDEIFSIG